MCYRQKACKYKQAHPILTVLQLSFSLRNLLWSCIRLGAYSTSSFFLTHDSACVLISGWSSWFKLFSVDGQLGGFQLFLLQTVLWTASSYRWINLCKWNLWHTGFVHLECWSILPHCSQKRLSSFTGFLHMFSKCCGNCSWQFIQLLLWFNSLLCSGWFHCILEGEISVCLSPCWLGSWRHHLLVEGTVCLMKE